MREFDNIKDMVYCEIDEISHQGKLDMTTVKILGDLVDILKDIGSIEMFEEGVEFQDDSYPLNRSYDRGYSQKRFPVYYNNGNSYRGGNNGYSRRGRSGYSRDGSKDHVIHKLEELMNDIHDEQDRQSIQMIIEQIDNQ